MGFRRVSVERCVGLYCVFVVRVGVKGKRPRGSWRELRHNGCEGERQRVRQTHWRSVVGNERRMRQRMGRRLFAEAIMENGSAGKARFPTERACRSGKADSGLAVAPECQDGRRGMQDGGPETEERPRRLSSAGRRSVWDGTVRADAIARESRHTCGTSLESSMLFQR